MAPRRIKQPGKKVERDFQEDCQEKGPVTLGSMLGRGLQVTGAGVCGSGRSGPRGHMKKSRFYTKVVGAVEALS